MKEKLKVGILLNTNFIQAWEYKILEDIIRSDFAGITLIIKNQSNFSLPIKKKRTLGFIVLKLHEKTDKLIFKNRIDYSKSRDLSDLLPHVPEIVINPVEEDSVERLEDEDIDEIKKHKLDILINFGFSIYKGDILQIPRYGIWSYRMGDARTVTSGYREVAVKYPSTSSVLEILKEGAEKGTIIYRSWESTYRFSINVNRNNLFWRASLFMPRVMNGVYQYGESYLDNLTDKYKKEEQTSIPESFLTPSFFPALGNFLFSFVVTARQIWKKIFYTDALNWMLLFKINGVKEFSENSFSTFTKLPSTNDRFWADPFIVSKNGKYFVFVEEFIYKTNKGHISVIELDESGKYIGTERIIEKPYHMSYPFIFELDNTYYIIPETSQNETIDLYKCTRFPDKWEFVKSIMHGLQALDTTLFNYNGKWWLFTSIDKTNNISGPDTELFLFFSDDIFSDTWISHPNNPVVSDVRTARPAGKIFIHDDKIFRPSQDCSGRYGKALNFNQILTLTENEYEEILLSKVEPVWDNKLKGTHTFNFDNNIAIIDSYSYRSRKIL